MRVDFLSTLLLALSTSVQGKKVARRSIEHLEPFTKLQVRSPLAVKVTSDNATSKYLVNGTAIPDVNFDIGDSYAGLMPISGAANETKQLCACIVPCRTGLG